MPIKYDYNWDQLYEEQRLSGMNMKRFCREHDISYQSFKNHKYQSMKKADTISVVPVKPKDPETITFEFNGVPLSIDASIDD